MTARRRIALLLLVGIVAASPVQAAGYAVDNDDFAVTLPDGFLEPVIARMTNGITYAYQKPHRDSDLRALLQISVIEIPDWSREASAADVATDLDGCLAMFMSEVARTQSRFEIHPPATGELDSKPMRKARWLGKRDGVYMTGVLQCARDHNHYYVIHMQDMVAAAPETFSALNSSIRSIRFRR